MLLDAPRRPLRAADTPRSEEHTSELQSQSNLVCRLLLEKKKRQHAPHAFPTPPRPRSAATPAGPCQSPATRLRLLSTVSRHAYSAVAIRRYPSHLDQPTA